MDDHIHMEADAIKGMLVPSGHLEACRQYLRKPVLSSVCGKSEQSLLFRRSWSHACKLAGTTFVDNTISSKQCSSRLCSLFVLQYCLF